MVRKLEQGVSRLDQGRSKCSIRRNVDRSDLYCALPARSADPKSGSDRSNKKIYARLPRSLCEDFPHSNQTSIPNSQRDRHLPRPLRRDQASPTDGYTQDEHKAILQGTHRSTPSVSRQVEDRHSHQQFVRSISPQRRPSRCCGVTPLASLNSLTILLIGFLVPAKTIAQPDFPGRGPCCVIFVSSICDNSVST